MTFLLSLYLEMGPKKLKPCTSPAQKSAQKIRKKYGKRMTPQKRQRVRRALYDVSANKISIHKATEEHELSYSFLQRRVSDQVQEMVTDEKRKLKLSDIAGLPIGHVPKCLSKLFRDILDEGGEITREATDQPKPSFPPWPKPNEEGGGIVIPCKDILSKLKDLNSCFKELENILQSCPEGKGMKLCLQ